MESLKDDPAALVKFMQEPAMAEVTSMSLVWLSVCLAAGVLFYALPILFTKERTGLHDIASNTRVYRAVKKQKKAE